MTVKWNALNTGHITGSECVLTRVDAKFMATRVEKLQRSSHNSRSLHQTVNIPKTEWAGSFTLRPLYARGKRPWYPLKIGETSFRAGLNFWSREKILIPTRNHTKKKKYIGYTYKVTLRRIRENIVAVKKQKVLHISVRVCARARVKVCACV